MVENNSDCNQLSRCISEFPKALIAFSGGTDSTLLLKAALDALGPSNVMAVTMVSPLVTVRETEKAQLLAKKLGAQHRLIDFDPLNTETIAANPPDRCFYCKKAIFNSLFEIADQEGYPVILEGTNISDLGDYRPGLAAVKNMERVHSPFLRCSLDKAAIRKLARAAGLDNWDQPSQACLASRIPYGEPLTLQKLAAVSKAEQFLRESGFSQVRVRHHGDLARIEVLSEEMPAFLDPRQRELISQSIKSCGFKYVTFDIDGYRTGSLNEVLKDSQ